MQRLSMRSLLCRVWHGHGPSGERNLRQHLYRPRSNCPMQRDLKSCLCPLQTGPELPSNEPLKDDHHG